MKSLLEIPIHIESDCEYYTFYVHITHYCPATPAKTWGAWEDCYPAEEEELEWHCYAVEREIGVDKVELMEYSGLVDEYYEKISECILNEIDKMEDDYYD